MPPLEYTHLVRLQGWSWVGAFSMSSLTMYFPFLVIMIMIVTLYFTILEAKKKNPFIADAKTNFPVIGI